MKKIAVLTGSLFAANAAANACISLVRASGGTLSGMAFLVAPFFIQPVSS